MTANIHETDSNFYTGETPWHGLGFDATAELAAKGREYATGAEAQKFAGMDFRLTLNPCLHMDSAGDVHEIKDRFAHVREDRPEIVHGIVSDRFGDDVQPDLLFGLPDSYVEAGRGGYVTAGTLGGGMKLYSCAQLGSSKVITQRGVDDIINNFWVCTFANGGNGSLEWFRTSVRVVCDNTLRAARIVASERFKVKHSRVAREAFDASINESEIGAIISAFEEPTAQYQELADTPLDIATWAKVAREFADHVGGEVSAQKSEKKRDRLEGIRQAEVAQLVHLFHSGKGNDGVAQWDAFNAGTEWLDHHRVAYRNAANEAERTSKAIDSILFGDAVSNKEVLVEMLIAAS